MKSTVEIDLKNIPVSRRRESMTPKIVVCPPMEERESQQSRARGSSILSALSRRLSRRGTDDDSSASSSGSGSDSDRTDAPSSCSSDSGSDGGSGGDRRRRRRSAVSLRRVFQSLSLRSQSSSPTDRQRAPKKQPQPKRILRSPVTYTYVRGLSGLPTQRVPRQPQCNPSVGLHR